MSRHARGAILLGLALLWLLPAAGLAGQVSGELRGTTRWSGSVHLAGPVSVPAGAVLVIGAGTRVTAAAPDHGINVHGRLRIEGTAAAPVVFATPDGWRGIEFFEAGEGNVVRHAQFSKAASALSAIVAGLEISSSSFRECEKGVSLLREARARISDSLFEKNGIGIDSEMRSAHVIRKNRFLGHTQSGIIAANNTSGPIEENLFEGNKQGIGFNMRYTDSVSNNRFLRNEVGIFCNQTQNSPVVTGNLFEENKLALVTFSFSYPTIENNRFLRNEEAVRNDQFGSARVVHNLFRDNGTALYLYRKSNTVILKNQLENNRLAIFCDYSSYPQVRDNNFLGNTQGVKLGIYQSADWEKRSGSKRLIEEEAQRRNSRNPLLAQAPQNFTDLVDVSGNWWGKDTPALKSAGEKGNVAMFHDRHDQPQVRYEGYGKESYALDRVVFAPWLTAPVADAGPRK